MFEAVWGQSIVPDQGDDPVGNLDRFRPVESGRI